MKPLVFFDLLALVAAIFALIVIWRGWKRALRRDAKLYLLGVLSLILFKNFSNVLGWGGITEVVDPLEDFIEILVPMMWFLIFYSLLKEVSAQELRKSEYYYRTLLQSLHEDIMVIGPDYQITDINHSFLAKSGLEKDEIIGQHCYSISHGYDEPCNKHGEECRLRDVFKNGKPRNCLHEHHVKDGSTIWVDILLSPMKDEEGKVLQVAEAIRDVTDLIEAKKAIKGSEEQYRLLVENANDVIYIAQDGVVKFTNPKGIELSGYSAEELSKMPFLDMVHPEDREMVHENHTRRLAGEAETPSTYSFRIFNKAGDELWVQLNGVLIEWEGRSATLSFLRDVTKQRKLEIQLMAAQRMEALGTLAGGIAHDFNNLLMGIQGNASLMLGEKDTGHVDYEKLKNIEQYVKSGADLTKQLLGFARSGKYDVRPIDINEIIERSSEMFGRTKKEITIHRKYQEDVWTVEADQGQVEQVLLNLYVNAWQAMPGGGELYLETENITLDRNIVKPFSVKPGDYIRISVTDTGVGMDEATRQRIFEPFFTTKEMRRGTGLGMASVYGIIKNHDGFIDVYSEKGKGTTFKIYFPASRKRAVSLEKLAKGVLKGSETVLLVDDEDMIIDVGEKLLASLGYKTITTKSGEKAIEIFEDNKDNIDIVILDMILPDLSGSETFDRLREINPEIKVLLSSGYSVNGEATEILDRGCNGFIQKPFNIKQLSEKLREILDNV